MGQKQFTASLLLQIRQRVKGRSRGDTSAAQTHVALDDVVAVRVDVSGQAEVADLCHSSLSQEDVPGSQISVDALTDRRSVTDGTK